MSDLQYEAENRLDTPPVWMQYAQGVSLAVLVAVFVWVGLAL